ncbi:type I-E CRISPR-associated protein Cse1/CasA [Orrella sp. 11846]|uniref:type I-E CRISPR-associated protein Cse1/CasA n=1 Tax=Orrella sp. 11846 TaxID=3409913 RepID=UPI003B5AB3C2
MENRFNLIDEPWIPVADYGLVSLRDLFSTPEYESLGGNPIQKVAVFKLLLAIAQAACTPADEKEWRDLGAQGMAQKCLAYLDQWHDAFFLYGEKPFLQMPAIAGARILPFGAFLPEVSTGNTTVLTQSQAETDLSDADKALIILQQMGFALSGKKTDNSVVLTADYAGKRNEKGKPSTGKPGPSVGHMGLLHSFIMGKRIIDSIWLNLLSVPLLNAVGIFVAGVGVAPWEKMPSGEACPLAVELKKSYMGRLIPICRFCLLSDDGMHYSEGIAHAGYREGVQDLSVAIDNTGKEPKAQWADPSKRPWRELTSLLSFIDQSGSNGFQSWQIRFGLERARDTQLAFCVWSGGLRVSSNAGEQYVSGTDDVVESQIWLESEALGQSWFEQLKNEMDALDSLAKSLYGRVLGYFKEMTVDGKNIAAQSTNLFWQLCERDIQKLISNCDLTETSRLVRQSLRQKFAAYQHQSFDYFCPNETARQIDAWAKNRPNHYKYITQEAL